MKTYILKVCVKLFLALVFATIGFENFASADDYVPPVTNAAYKIECGSCHWAYLPGLLPARSWDALIDNLDKHFGEDASLDAEDLKKIKNYLITNSADFIFTKMSRKINRSVSTEQILLRITEVPYIQREHNKIPDKIFKRSDIRSFSNCTACHKSADQGNFDDDDD